MIRKASKKTFTVIPRDYLSTGSTGLDLSISALKAPLGGIPTSRIVEFSGTGAAGKSYICGEIAGSAIRKKYKVFVDDIERRWDLSRLPTFGFDMYDPLFTYFDPPSSSVEGCFERMFSVLDKGKGDEGIVYIIDPIAALYSEVELTHSDKMGQARAKALQRNMRYLKDRVNDKNRSILILFSNQLIDEVGKALFGKAKMIQARSGPSQVTPGGNAMKHWPSVRVRFKQIQKITNKSKLTTSELSTVDGVSIGATIVKNSEDNPHRQCIFTIKYGYGIDDIKDNASWLKKYTKALNGKKKTGDGWFFFEGTYTYSLSKFVKFVEENDLELSLRQLVAEHYRTIYSPESRKKKY